jgi:2-haloalkanoic acid dehalogenase type II
VPFPDTNASLERLRTAGYALGILSNVDDDLLAATRRQLPVDFDVVVTAEQVRGYKPAPGHFEAALRAVGGDSARLVHVAQSYFHDVRPAAGLGIRTVWVNRLGEQVPAGRPRPTAEVADLDAAAEWLEGRGC